MIGVNLDIDTSLPAGAVTRRIVTRRHGMVALQHHDLPSAMVGKIHVVVTRPYTKGPDWYDLVWYLSQVPPVQPNDMLLRNALALTRTDLATVGLRELLASAAEHRDFASAARDLRPFLAPPEEAAWVTRDAA